MFLFWTSSREREGVVREVMCIGRLRERMAVAGKVD